jgi:Zn-dependent protease with chaperone function
MAIQLQCRCKNSFEVPDKMAGNTTMCPGCGTFLDVPEPGKQPPPREERKSRSAPSKEGRRVERDEGEPEELSRKELIDLVRDALEGDIKPVRRTAGYHFGVACVAMAMLCLPGLYVGLIIGVALLMFWHATTNYTLFGEIRPFAAGLAYFVPLIAGTVLIAFMIKPVLARPPRVRRGRSINIEKEQVLATFVDEIAWAVHAPKPKRIEIDCDVNASAGLGRGIFAVFGNNLTLTIGLPLVAGMTAKQLGGILAHEFGHFSQGAAMRFSFVVRMVNNWFGRVVHERDGWDEALADWAEGGGYAGAIAWFVQLCVLMTRVILWVFMMIGHMISGFMMRRMEFDADRSEVRLVGVRTFEKTFRRMAVMSAAAEEAGEIIVSCWQNERYPDNYPDLVVGLADTMSTRDRDDVYDEMEDAGTGLFDTHPSFEARLASAEREDPRGVFNIDLPASALFRNLPKLSASASLDLYKAVFGRWIQPTLRPVEEYLSR